MQRNFQTHHPVELSADEAHALDERLAELAGSESRQRLHLGELLSRMERHSAAQKLGYPDTGTYGYQTIQMSRRWCDDSRRLATRLANLPLLRAALLRNLLSWSMVELIARKATPETEAELIEQARMHSVREMKAALKTPRDEPEAERSTITATIERPEDIYFESTRMLVAAITDSKSNDEFAEAVLAEGLTRLIDVPGLDLTAIATMDARLTKLRAQMSVAREEREAARDATRTRKIAEAEAAEQRWANEPTDHIAMDDEVLSQLRSFAAIEVELAHALRRLAAGRPWDLLAYDSLAQYARERLGMSEATAHSRIDLAGTLQEFPALEEALLEGRFGLEAARLLGRIAEDHTIDAWIERASGRTLVHLREEVDASGLLSRVSGDRRLAAPPDDEALEAVFEMERDVLAHVIGEPQTSVSEVGDRRLPKVTIKLSLRQDLAIFWRELERVYAQVARKGIPFVTFLCHCLWDSWRGSEARIANYAYIDVHLRERFRCANPVCSRRDVAAHHVIFRSHGGGEERGNLVAICSRCHLEGVHRYYLGVSGTAPAHLRWVLNGGRVVVDGRQLRRAFDQHERDLQQPLAEPLVLGHEQRDELAHRG